MTKIFENKITLLIIAVLFCVLNTFLVASEIYYLLPVPIVLFVLWAVVFRFQKFMLVLMFLVPISVQLSEVISVKLPIDMSLPSEPLIVGILLLFILKIFHGQYLDKKFLLHPVSIVLYGYLAWMIVTAFNSTIPLVSFKLFLNRIWFVVPFYLIFGMMFSQKDVGRKFMSNYIYGLAIVAIYGITRTVVLGGIDEKVFFWAANPFFKDHTSYGALLAFFIPASISLSFYKKYSVRVRMIFIVLSSILFLALVMSFSRAAWMSLIGAMFLWIAIRLKIKFRIIIIAVTVLALVVVLLGQTVFVSLSRNNQDSSNNIKEHIVSSVNVSTDASNLERVNRWKCALKMVVMKPVFGWGPGTYAFQYAPFQLSTDKTIISTRQGNVGNAHSEYLGALAEQGVLGVVFYLLLIIFTMVYGIRAIHRSSSAEMKMLGIAAILGLFTYYLHGFLNNFLDTDKAAVPFWGFTALLVAIDVYYRKKPDVIDKTDSSE